MKIILDKNLYSIEAIKNTINAYQNEGIGDFAIKEKGDSFVIEGSNIEEDMKEEIKNEFCNFLVSEMKNYYRV